MAWAEPVTLIQAETLLAHNRDLLVAQRAVDAARAGATIAGQAPNPTLTYSNANISPNLGIGKGSLLDKRFDQSLALSQLIERGSKRSLRSGGAEALLRAANADLADVRRQQRLMLHQDFYDLMAAQEKVKLLAETTAIYDRLLEVASLRLRAGDIAAVETSRLKVEVLRARNDERAARTELAQARQSLAYLIGESARADQLVADAPWPDVAAPDTVAAAVDRRPDLRAARERVEAARQARQLAKSQTTRDVTVGAQLGRSLGYSSYMPAVSYGFSLSVPLFARYAYEGEIAQAETAYTVAVEAGETVKIQAQQEVARAHADLAAATERRRRTENEALPEARRVADAAEFAYRKGALSLSDLLDARRTLRAVELDAVTTRADHAKALAAWQAATEWELEQ
jgi:cobalt-zinc-cadmium efflux system outer membrane protein